MLKFLFRFLENPRTTGALLPSSSSLARRLVEPLRRVEKGTLRPLRVLELGAGTGAVTVALEGLTHSFPDLKITSIELQKEFYLEIRKKFKNIEILNMNAIDFLEKTDERFDFIVCGIPLSMMSKEDRKKLLSLIHSRMNPYGIFSFFQYSPFLIRGICNTFDYSEISFEVFNFPPAFVVYCTRQS